MDRRTAIGLGAAGLAAIAAGALATESLNGSTPGEGEPETVPLWPGTPPGGTGVRLKPIVVDRNFLGLGRQDRALTGIAMPTLSVYRPSAPSGAAVLIAPGGGYSHILFDKEGSEVAARLNQAGMTAFVLTYRLPWEGWSDRQDVPLQDAQRAMRVIRAGASRFGVDPARAGVLGFSAGGHVAASLATRHAVRSYPVVDGADSMDAKPVFTALLYPVITMMQPFAHEASREKLLGEHATAERRAAYSCERLVDASTPPSFLVAALDDTDVPPENSLALFASLRAAHVPVEMHLFEEGGHGFALRKPDKPVGCWPDLLLHWLASRGILKS
jgi:acetyl esterase/lipase